MVRHTQTIRRAIADKLSVFDHSVGLALKGLKLLSNETFLELKSLMGVEVMGKSQESVVLRP